MAFQIEGKLYRVTEEQSVSERFRKREFVLEIQDGDYPQHVKFQLTQDRCALVDKYKVGDRINVHFDLTGREYNSPKGELMNFTNLNAWRIEGPAQSNTPPPAAQGGFDAPFPGEESMPPAPMNNTADDLDDLPF